jgi:hypothetical protein
MRNRKGGTKKKINKKEVKEKKKKVKGEEGGKL